MSSAATRSRVWMISRASHESAVLRDELRAQELEVVTLNFPGSEAHESLTGPGLSGIAASLGAAIREVIDGVDITGLEAEMATSGPSPDAVLFLEADVANRVRTSLRVRVGSVRQVAVEPHLSLDERWSAMKLEVISAREHGGVLSGLGQEERRLEGQAPPLVIATHGIDVGWVDPLLLQLSIASLDSRPLIFLPSGDPSVDDQLKSRAAFYGLEGQRPTFNSDLDVWIRGARAVIGRPSDRQTVAALSRGVPILFVGELGVGSSALWAVKQGLSHHGRAPVEVSVALERCLREPSPEPVALAGPTQAAEAVLKLLSAERVVHSESAAVDDQGSLEPIGLAAHEEEPSPEHERLEIDDALAQLKKRMGMNDVEG